jgi:tol-pal system protein YbgF
MRMSTLTLSSPDVRCALFALALALLSAGCSLTKPEEEPAYIKATAVEQRVDRIEQQNKALLDMQRQLDAVQADVRRLRGDLEESAHEAKGARGQQQDLYRDLDKRLQAVEAKLAAAALPAAGAGPGNDKDAYQAALDKLKNRDYDGAEQSLKDFLSSYPQSTFADNALYWLGETYYVEKRYPDALDAFERVAKEHPDSRKVPDALLKAGYTQYEQKRFREARELLSQVVSGYPDSPAAAEARERLKRLNAEQK